MIAGGVVMGIGCFLPWLSFDGEGFNGFADGGEESSDGWLFITLGVILLGFGIATLFAKRLLPIAILAVVFASFGVLGALADLGDANDLSDLLGLDVGPGLPIILVGSLVGLAGGIVALATRRR